MKEERERLREGLRAGGLDGEARLRDRQIESMFAALNSTGGDDAQNG